MVEFHDIEKRQQDEFMFRGNNCLRAIVSLNCITETVGLVTYEVDARNVSRFKK